MTMKDTKAKANQLYVYMVAWTVHRVYEVVGAGNQTLGWHFASQLSIVALAVSSVLFNSIRLWIMAMIAVLCANVALMPFIWDSEYWCIFTDFGVVISTISTFGCRRLASTVKLVDNEKETLFRTIRPIIVTQMIIFYSAAFFWKLNWDFLHPHSSCSPIFVMQLVDHILPSFMELPDMLSVLIVQTAPLLVLLLEGYIAVSFCNPRTRKYGVLAAMVLHISIAACPPPSNVATFSLMCASRLVCFVPNGCLYAVKPDAWSSLEVATAIVATAVTAKIADHKAFYDMAYPLFVFVTPFLLKAAWLDDGNGNGNGNNTSTTTITTSTTTTETTNDSVTRSKVGIVSSGLAFVYAYLLIVFGLMDQGQPHMYANLRLHGGSNHILGIPTSLLQQWFQDDVTSTFGGGIVRIESSTLQSLNEIYPGDYTNQMSERSRQFMIAGGHSSRNFNPMLTAVTSSEAPWVSEQTSGEFVKYTMPAHEFRRILEEARRNNNNHDKQLYVIEYTQLFGLGDEIWRSTAAGRTIRLQESGRGNERDCRVVATEEVCTDHDLPNLGPLPFWARKLLLFEPYPILPDDYKLHCFGP